MIVIVSRMRMTMSLGLVFRGPRRGDQLGGPSQLQLQDAAHDQLIDLGQRHTTFQSQPLAIFVFGSHVRIATGVPGQFDAGFAQRSLYANNLAMQFASSH